MGQGPLVVVWEVVVSQSVVVEHGLVVVVVVMPASQVYESAD